MIKDEGEPPTLCDACCAQLEGTVPTIVGWPLLVFTCKTCGLEFCPHLERPSGGNVCIDCAAKPSE